MRGSNSGLTMDPAASSKINRNLLNGRCRNTVNAAFNQSVDLRLYLEGYAAGNVACERVMRRKPVPDLIRDGNRFADKIMRQVNKSARGRMQNRYPLLLLARV
jgi:hypothetical protein